MAGRKNAYSSVELSRESFPDFARLFSQGGGWDHCWCMHFHRPRGLPASQRLSTRAERAIRNRRQKKALVEDGRSHGILVYADGEPVGWCQYGLRDELPRIDNSRYYRGLALKHTMPETESRLWRITCFVVHKKYRRRGVATAALKAALASIHEKGGGIVEGYPISRWQPGTFGNESTNGTVSMFKKEGFKTVAFLGSTRFSSHLLMRKAV